MTTIAGQVFGKAIHSLSRIGEEIYIEALDHGLSLRTVNSSRSAYGSFLFFTLYFQQYDCGGEGDQCSEMDGEGMRCKINMKSVMSVFRSLSMIERNVDKCEIYHVADDSPRIVFQLHCRHGIVKSHHLAYVECETLQAIFCKETCPNILTASSKLFSEVVVNFQAAQEEITFSASSDSLSLRNYVDDEPELTLAPQEFDSYRVTQDAEITFCLKEFRAILAFGEATSLPLNLYFRSAGSPLTFSVDGGQQTFEASFVLATLADADYTSSQIPSQQPLPATTVAQQRRPTSTRPTSSQRRGRQPCTGDSLGANPISGRANADGEGGDGDMEETAAPLSVSCVIGHRALIAPSREVQNGRGGVGNGRSLSLSDRSRREDATTEETASSPVIARQGLFFRQERQQVFGSEPEDDLDDTVPGTPPAKKFKALFFGSTQIGTQVTVSPQQPAILAVDTDEES